MYVKKNHPKTKILGEKGAGVQRRRTITKASSYLALLSSTEHQNVNEAWRDECWVKAMNEELEQIENNNTWELDHRNQMDIQKQDEWKCRSYQNKARLISKGYAQQEGIDFEKTFAPPIVLLEAIRMFLVLSSFQKFKVYQMDVKSAFLNGDLEE